MQYTVTKAWREGDDVMAEMVGPGDHVMLGAISHRHMEPHFVLSDDALDQIAAKSVGKSVEVTPPRALIREGKSQ